MDNERKETFSEAFFSIGTGNTLVIINNCVFIIEDGTNEIRSLLSDYIGRAERYFSVISSILFDRSGLQVAKNFDDYLDLDWLIRIHQKTGECRKAIMAIAGACNNEIGEDGRTHHIGLLEKLLENSDVEYFLRNLATAKMLGHSPDIDGAIVISHKISADKAEEIFTDRMKRIVK